LEESTYLDATTERNERTYICTLGYVSNVGTHFATSGCVSNVGTHFRLCKQCGYPL